MVSATPLPAEPFEPLATPSAKLSENAMIGVRRRALAHLIPPPKLKLSEWIEANMRLPAGVSATPGSVTLFPYQREIADSIGDPEIERVTLIKCVRVGFTTLLTGALASYVANDPSPVLALLPTEADCRDYVVSDVEPIFAATPALRGLLSADQDEAGRNTLLSRRFPGGSLKVVAGKAPRNLRRHNARVLLVDEADAIETGAEGSVLRLAERRTMSFSNRKIVIGSTPLLEATSNVQREYLKSDQRVFEVPCPACGGFTEILWSHIEWEPDRPETAAFRCPHCGDLVAERHKPAMVELGRWRATCPDVTGHAGFRINALVSPLKNASWGVLAAEFLQAKEDSSELQTFVNTILGQVWRDSGDEVDDTALSARAEPFGLTAIPGEVLSVTVGVDVQDDRLECTFAGWTRDGDALVLAHVVLWGEATDDGLWAELDELLHSRWTHPLGGQLREDAAGIDASDGDHYDIVCRFCGPRMARRVVALKGIAGTRPAIKASATKGHKLFLVGVDGLKGTILTRLARGRTIRFSQSLDPSYFEQLASEKRVVRYTRGSPVRRFERIPGRRAEALDALVYAFAVRGLAPFDADQREAALRLEVVAKPAAVIRSAWLDRSGR